MADVTVKAIDDFDDYGGEGSTLLALGGTPGKAYEPRR